MVSGPLLKYQVISGPLGLAGLTPNLMSRFSSFFDLVEVEKIADPNTPRALTVNNIALFYFMERLSLDIRMHAGQSVARLR